jgi:hypothetical protein
LVSVATMVIAGNLAIAIALIGGLSVIRFRNTLSSPLENVVVFWAVAIGMATGSRFHALAAVATGIGIGLVLILRSLRLERFEDSSRLVQVVADGAAPTTEAAVEAELGRHFRSVRLLQSSTSAAGSRWVLWYRVRGRASLDIACVFGALRGVPGVSDVRQARHLAAVSD